MKNNIMNSKLFVLNLKEKYLNSIDGVVIVKESGPDSLEEGEKLRQDERIALLGSQGNEFFAVVKLADE